MNAAAVFHKVLVPIDFSDGSLAALSQAMVLAKAFDTSVTLLHVIPQLDSATGLAFEPEAMMAGWRLPENAAELEQRLQTGARQQLDDLATQYRSDGVDVHTEVRWGAAFREIIHAVQEEGHDLVVAGTRGRSTIARLLVGSTSTRLVRKCPCPVWIAKADVRPLTSILAPIDFSEVSHESLRLAGALAAAVKCPLHILHVFDPGYSYLFESLAEEAVDFSPPWRRHQVISQLRTFAVESGLAVEPILHAEHGDVAHQIVATAEKIDAGLVVVGTMGRAGVGGLLIGNTAEKVLHTCGRPLLAIKPLGYVSPVEPAAALAAQA